MILARVIGDAELEALAHAKLERERDVVMGVGGTFAQAVGDWSEQMLEHSPVDISDLLELKRPLAADGEVLL